MIRKLRIKFIIIAMGSLLAVIVMLMGMINLLNYNRMIEHADAVLDILVENDGKFPKTLNAKDFFGEHKMSQETPYETRFFVVHLNEQEEVVYVDTGKVAAVNITTAASYVEKAIEKDKMEGFIGEYRYRKKAMDEGYMFVFLDCNRSMDSFQGFLVTSAGVSILGVFLVFLLILFLSGRAIKPVYESYEKQKRFITDAGHEIKTPLAIIHADIDVLKMDIGENEWLVDVQKQTKRLSELTKDLIYLAKMEEKNNHLQMIDLPFSDIVEETSQSFQALAVSQNKTITLNIQPMIKLFGDEKALRQLVSILLDNAIKYSEKEADVLGEWVKTLPEPFDKEMAELYQEMEAQQTLESRIYKALDKLEALIQHNESDIKTWIPLEYNLQMTYGNEQVKFSDYLTELRE